MFVPNTVMGVDNIVMSDLPRCQVCIGPSEWMSGEVDN